MIQESHPLIGRSQEIEFLESRILRDHEKILVIYGPSGIGKTRLIETFCGSTEVSQAFDISAIRTLYRTDWTTALAELKRFFGPVPANATLNELENVILETARGKRLLLVLDNVDDSNVSNVASFAGRWLASSHASTLVITAQPEIRAVLPVSWLDLRLEGLRDEGDILTLLGGLTSVLPVEELRQVGQVLDGNPQLLLFLRWLEPASVLALRESVAKLAERETAAAVEDLVDQTSLSSLFFLALGVHKDLNVNEELLAALWDHFGSRGAEPFVRSVKMLVERGFLAPTAPGSYRLHESVHVSLPKALRYRVGEDRIPSLHHYFAEYYRRMLYRSPSSGSLTHFIYHAGLASDYRLIYDTLIAGEVAEAVASQGTAVQVQAELESLGDQWLDGSLLPQEVAQWYLVLGRLCNDLSDHERALSFMSQCEAHLSGVEQGDVASVLRRELFYISAVAYSNTGQSDACLQNYFRIVDSCRARDDHRACLSLGYLAHDLKYRDLATAVELGEVSVLWARSFDSGAVLAKNLCSYAESLSTADQRDLASGCFREAEAMARAHSNNRELGRILTNWGFTEMLAGDARALAMIQEGTELSRNLGDRRRYLQGMLYGGVCLVNRGDRVRGRTAISQATSGLDSLHDGRYLMPGIMWLLQVDGVDLTDEGALTGEVPLRPDTGAAWLHACKHPEFGIYREFWCRHLRSCIPGRP